VFATAIHGATAAPRIRCSSPDPLEEVWLYFARDEIGEPDDPRLPPCPAVSVAAGRVVRDDRMAGAVVSSCERAGIREGMPVESVVDRLGSPIGMCWSYTRSPSRAYYRARVVCFESGKVFDVMRRWERG